jgi:phosphatidate cytidylyltransferase
VLLQRLAVAAVGLPALAALVWAPEPWFAVAVTLILAVATFEMLRALAPDRPYAVALSAGVATALFVALVRSTPDLRFWPFLLPMVAALALILRPQSRLAASLGGWWMTAVLYVGVLGAHLILLRGVEDGQAWLVVLLAATFATDTGAYAIGRLFGRRLLAPRISPAKTWEGGAGGFVAGTAAGIGAAFLLELELEGVQFLWLALLPVAAIAGDLLESALKRAMDVKDMSRLLPGHGGLLDRLDSILVVGACLYWIMRWFQST